MDDSLILILKLSTPHLDSFSRFDLIYLILDKADEETDRRLAKHIVALHFENPNVCTFSHSHFTVYLSGDSFIRLGFAFHSQSSQLDVIDLPTLTAYVNYARKHIHPQLSDEAAEELTRGYVEMRKRGNFPGSSKKVIYCIHFFKIYS